MDKAGLVDAHHRRMKECTELSRISMSDRMFAYQTWYLVPQELHAVVGPPLNSFILRMLKKSMDVWNLMYISHLQGMKIKGYLPPIPYTKSELPTVQPPISSTQFSRMGKSFLESGGDIRKAYLRIEEMPDEELCLELQSLVEQNSALLGEMCVNSVGKLLDRNKELCIELKKYEALFEKNEEEIRKLMSVESVRAGVENLGSSTEASISY